jgi:DNA polymerase-1
MKTYTLLFDADHLMYTAAAAAEHETRWDADNHVLASNAEEVWMIFTRIAQTKQHFISEWLGGSPEFKLFFCFTGNALFRSAMYDGYKAGRSRKPLCYWTVIQRVFSELSAGRVDCLEADDLMGIMATQGRVENPIIVSEDKDLLTIPGLLWRQETLHTIEEHEADQNWLRQTLSGDPTDGYPGCPGIGAVKAEKYVQRGWEGVVEAFEKAGLTEDDALLQARLARILRASDWNSEKKEPILWSPPSASIVTKS